MLYKITISEADEKWMVRFEGESGNGTTQAFLSHPTMMDYVSGLLRNMAPEQKKINDYSEANS